jgi:hypothetical protein
MDVQLIGESDSKWPYLRHPVHCATSHVTATVGECVAAEGGEDLTGGGPWSSSSSVP